jgi:predicted MFS family arabinose efflux permease
LAGNLGLAIAAVVTGLLVKYFGWRMAFVIPGILSVVCGVLFAIFSPSESTAPAKKKSTSGSHEGMSVPKLLLIMTIASSSGSMLFNFSTNSNYELLTSKFSEISQDPAMIGFFLAVVYVLASFTQLLVGHLLDRVALKTLFRSVIIVQFFALILANMTNGWMFYAAQLLFMAAIFGAVPFTDAMIVRYVDDHMRSRVAGLRLTLSLGFSSLAVWSLGPLVKAGGFGTLFMVMAGISLCTAAALMAMPGEPRRASAA